MDRVEEALSAINRKINTKAAFDRLSLFEFGALCERVRLQEGADNFEFELSRTRSAADAALLLRACNNPSLQKIKFESNVPAPEALAEIARVARDNAFIKIIIVRCRVAHHESLDFLSGIGARRRSIYVTVARAYHGDEIHLDTEFQWPFTFQLPSQLPETAYNSQTTSWEAHVALTAVRACPGIYALRATNIMGSVAVEAAFASRLMELPALQDLTVEWVRSGAAAETMAQVVRRSRSLEEVQLHGIMPTIAVRVLADAIRESSSLSILRLNADLTGEDIRHIAKAIESSNILHKLNLNFESEVEAFEKAFRVRALLAFMAAESGPAARFQRLDGDRAVMCRVSQFLG